MTQIPPLDRLLAEEPFVRTLATALLAEEADEVVQLTWLRAMKHGGHGITRPRSWLASIARNVAHNLRRDRQRRTEREREAAPHGLAPSSSELSEREEQRRRLVEAIDALPNKLRSVLLLRFYEGLAPRHIAAKTGLSNDLIRNRIRRALQLLRERLDRDAGGDRRAWMLALVPLACPTPAQAAPAAAATTPIAAAAAVALVATAAGWTAWSRGPATLAAAPASPRAAAPPTAAAPAEANLAKATGSEPAPVAVAPVEDAVDVHPAPPPRGALEVRVLHSDGAPAAGVRVLVHDHDADQRTPRGSARADGAGVVRFASLPARELCVSCDRGTLPTWMPVTAGALSVREYRLPPGVHVTGEVVDELGRPVPFAAVEGAPLGLATLDVQRLGRADARGRFELRDVHTKSVLGARAPGRLPGVMQALRGRPGSAVSVRLTVGAAAVDVYGVVVDGDGAPVPGAVVRVGDGFSSGLHLEGNVLPPAPALAWTDERGAFVARGVERRDRVPVAVIARGFAPWLDEIDAGRGTADLTVALQPGAVVTGRVTTPDGAPATGASVEFGQLHAFDYQRTLTDDDGRFRLERLSPGPIELRAHAQRVGGATCALDATAGEVTCCRLRLDGRGERHPAGPGPNDHAQPRPPLARAPDGQRPPARGRPAPDGPRPPARGSCSISGFVLGPDDAPLANGLVVATRSNGQRIERLTGDDGGFDLAPLPPGGWRVEVFAAGLPPVSSRRFALQEHEDIDLGELAVPRGGRLRVRLPDHVPGHARVFVRPAEGGRRRPAFFVHDARETDYLQPGDYEVFVVDRREELARARATVVADRVVEVLIR